MGMMPHSVIPTKRTTALQARSLKILMVTARFYPHSGGTETHVAEVGQRLATLGHQVTVLTTRPDASWPQQEDYQGMTVVRMYDWLAGRDVYLSPLMLRQIRSGEWDVVHYQGCTTMIPPVALLGTQRLRTPTVMTFHLGGHSSNWRTRFRAIQWQIMRPLLRQVDQFIAVSHYEAEHFASALQMPRDQITVIPNGIPVFAEVAFPENTREPGLILSIGRLESYKGHQRIIAAFPHVLGQMPEARLEILGKGPYESELRMLIRQLEIEDQVRIRYFSPDQRNEFFVRLHQARLVMLMSESESHPIAIMEALACGCAALVSDTTGLRELIQNGLAKGVALDAADERVAQSILEQLRQPQVPDRQRLPTWDQSVEQIVALYRHIVPVEG